MVGSMERYYKALAEVKGAPAMSMGQIKKYVDRVGIDNPRTYKELRSAGVTAEQVSKATGIPMDKVMQSVQKGRMARSAGIKGIAKPDQDEGMNGQGQAQ